MADGPRCKRRKQANPKRSNVTNFNNGLEASSDSDDEDKLHIVEEDSLQEPEAAAAATAAAAAAAAAASAAISDETALQDSCTAAAVLSHNGFNGVKEERVSEDEDVKDTLVEQILQQGDTAIIYPEAPEDDQSPAETGGADENGTPDSFSQLHTCPYCSRGYKRNASLKEHIKYRHETSEDNYSCSHCSYTFTYRSQLERHMSHHRGARDQSAAGLGGATGTRKFKCNECSKAFKYKHHLKEHLRIHSGEKPYECSNCKKRFSHSGSYSSHISSKKCVSAAPPNGTARSLLKVVPAATAPSAAQVVIAPARGVLKEKSDSRLLSVNAIKSEPVEYECKPAVAAAAPASSVNAKAAAPQSAAVPATAPGAASGPQGVAMMVPTVGLMSPVSININDLQSVLKVAMDGNVLRQVLGSANGVAAATGKQGVVVQQPQQQIISLPAFVDHDGTTKIIINYSISPAAAATAAVTQPAPLAAKSNVSPTATAAADPTPSKTDKPPTPEAADLSKVKTEPEPTEVGGGGGTCLLCDDCPDNLEALHLLQHHKAANGEAVDSAALDPSFADLLSEAGVTLEEPPVDDLLSLLKTYFASNARPSEDDLSDISRSVSIPVEVVRKWFAKMNACGHKKTEPADFGPAPECQNGEAEPDSGKDASPPGLVVVKSEPEDTEVSASQAEPLDLSLPKHLAAAAAAMAKAKAAPTAKQQEQPLNLTCLRKEQLGGRTIYVTTPQAGNSVNIVAAGQLPTLVAIAGQGGVSCLGAINTASKRTILIPQLTYTYATTAGNAAGAKTVVLNGHKQQPQQQEKKPDSSSDSVSATEEQNDSDSAAIKKRRLENGVYPCDLCSKVFQKGSSLLRHKYEHTGKRPHECNVCKKAFKHKHHLIEHSRLHSGEKPYQCDKCGKRFSHSGSYSQHMNHRYSYCKKDSSTAATGGRSAAPELGSPDGGGVQSDSRTTTPPSQLDSDERDSEEEEEEFDEDDEAICMDDIRVVQVDDGECEIYEGNFDDDEEEDVEEEAGGAQVAAQEAGEGEEELVEEAAAQREGDEGGEKEEAGEEMEKDGEKEQPVAELMEMEPGDNHMENGTEDTAGEEEGGEDKEEVAASEAKEEMADCDEDADSGGIQPSEEAESEAK